MKISGFTFVKNADKLYYPVKAAIASILDIVDEFVVALGDCDPDDKTRDEILSLNSDKVKIIDTVWDLQKYPRGMEHAHQTDIAKEACSGDWLFYLQSDEVIHERYLSHIREMCEKYVDDKRVEGFLFKYMHFWGDYDHYHNSHSWYPKEIRIVRNDPDIHSWESAQSFRRIPDFDGINYRVQEGTHKLNVIELDAYVYHYGWVRPPEFMQRKRKAFSTIHRGKQVAEAQHSADEAYFDYGPLNELAVYKDSQPAVMKEWVEKFDWADKLQYAGPRNKDRPKHKHEKIKYRLLTFVEQNFRNGELIGGFKNYKIIR